jgi:3-oxoadipate enol-lactonase
MKGEKMPELKTAATKIHYQLEGPLDGPVVMLAHSLGVTLSMWDPQVPALTAMGYRVLRYDHRGHGRSDVPPGPYTIAQMARDVIDLLDGLGLEKVHFCGLSLGGMVGQELGARYGQRLHLLILCSTSSYMPPRETWEERIRSVSKNGMGVVIDGTIDRWFTKADQARLPTDVQKVREALSKMSVEGFCACCAAIRDMDLREAIRAIGCPTLIMVGEHDQGTPVTAARFIHERITPSRLVVIADAAHLQNVAQADVFTKTMLEFLEENA